MMDEREDPAAEGSEADESIEDEPVRSRTQLRAERKAYQAELDAMTKRLVGLSDKALREVALDPVVEEAVRQLGVTPKGSALARQRRYVARSLRAYDLDDLTRRVDEALGDRTGARAQRLERWRSRLLEEGDGALAELLEEHPMADRQRLRQAVRAAIAEEKKTGARGRRFKELYQVLAKAMKSGA